MSTIQTSYMTRRRFVLAGTVGGLVPPASMALVACGGETQGEAPGGKAALPAELTWMGWSMDQEFLLPSYEEAAAGFAAKHPASKIALLPPGGGYREKYTTLVAAGTPPDVADVHWQQHVRDVGPSGLTQDLTVYLKKDAYPKDYVGWEPYQWQGKQYGVPTAIQSTGLYFNKALFDEAGVRYPDESWTWERFVEAARRLTKPGPDDANTIWGAGDQGGRNVGWINALLHSFGGAVFSRDYKSARLGARESLEAIEFRASWGPRYKITPTVPGGTSGRFTGGKMAMVTSGSWFVANVKRNANSALNTGNVPWDVAPVPKGPARHGGLTHELGIGIPSGVLHPEASWAAVRHLTSKEGLLPFAHVGRYIPPQRSLWKEAIPTDGAPAGFKKTFLDQWERLNVMSPFVPDFQQLNPAWQEELDPVWTGERPARDGVSALEARIEEFLRRLQAEGKL